jgi:hypothetical protein
MSDILHEDQVCCILKPDSKRGVVVFTYVSPEHDMKLGLLSMRQALEHRLTTRNRGYLRNVVFFRPPLSEYVTKRLHKDRKKDSIAYGIRVDPEKTYVYYQNYHEIHNKTTGEPRMKMSDYMKHISDPQLQKTFPEDLRFEISNEYYYDDDMENVYSFSASDAKFFEIRVRKDKIPNNWLINPPKMFHPLTRSEVQSIAGPKLVPSKKKK